MRHLNFTHLAVLIIIILFHSGTIQAEKNVNLFDLEAKAIDGKTISLKSYQGKVLLITNIALKCGTTPQLYDLQKLYQEYQTQGLEILAFPSNDFTGKEPKQNQVIEKICTEKYQVTFPIFESISVTGKNLHSIFSYLTNSKIKDWQGPVMFNFEKFLINQHGEIAGRYGPFTSADSYRLKKDLEKLLKNK